MAAQGHVVQEGDWLVIRVNEGLKYIVVQVAKNNPVRGLRKKQFPSTNFLGKEIGQFFECEKSGNIVPWDKARAVQVRTNYIGICK